MSSQTFSVVPATDNEYFVALEKIKDDGFGYSKIRFGESLHIEAKEVATHEGLHEILNQNVKAFTAISCTVATNTSIRIERQPDPNSLFDKVTINAGNMGDPVQFAKLCASAQRHLGATSLHNLGNLLGPEAQKHFEARDAALTRLETLVATLIHDVEESRKARDEEFEQKTQKLDETHAAKREELEAEFKAKQEQFNQRTEELDKLRKELDDRAAKHARRQHYKDIKEKFKSWGESFQVTEGTSKLRGSVFWGTIVLMLIFGGLAASFLWQSVKAEDTTHLVAAIIKQTSFTVLFVSTAFFFIRWNNQWFQRHANEEFRLKRMELDIDRASWFVEMAFEWKDEKGEDIPLEVIDRLTAGLFATDQAEKSIQPNDSLVQALLGASRFTVKLNDGTEVEYDRKGVQKLVRDRTQK